MKITCTNGNSKNKIKGSRISFYDNNGNLLDRFTVPARNGKYYCKSFPNGKYGKRFFNNIEKFENN